MAIETCCHTRCHTRPAAMHACSQQAAAAAHPLAPRLKKPGRGARSRSHRHTRKRYAPQASADVSPQGSRTHAASRLHAALKGAAARRAEAAAGANRSCSRRLAIVLPDRMDCGPHCQTRLGTNHAGRPSWRPCSLLLLRTSPQYVVSRPPSHCSALNVACKPRPST
jgi:hypothetical protein